MRHRGRVGLRAFLGAWVLYSIVPTDAWAFRSGPPAGTNGSTASGGTSCRICHGSTAGAGGVQILGFPSQYIAGTQYDIIVRVFDPAKLGAGFQISFERSGGQHAGLIIETDSVNTQINANPGWMNHTLSGVGAAVSSWSSLGNAAVYNLRWQAPASDVGSITAWAAGNAINNNFSNSGDVIYLTNRTATFGGLPTGACCDESDGECTEDVTDADCSGRWGGADSTCAGLDPPCAARPGACCDELSGICTDGVFVADCPDRWGGPGSTCVSLVPPCLPPHGACCDGNDGSCTDGLAESACVGDQFSWTALTDCADLEPPCSEHTGACCDLLSGGCADDVPGSECVGTHRAWTKGVTCGSLTCDIATGACCDHDTFGACNDGVTLGACDCPTCQWFKLESCDDLDCRHAAIPTVSTWGLAVLALLLLITGKIAFRQQAAS